MKTEENIEFKEEVTLKIIFESKEQSINDTFEILKI